jgi:hypothetical protein
MTPAQFIERWKDSGGAELANSQSFLKELCDLLDVPHPEPTVADETLNGYVFEKAVEFNNGDGTVSQGRIDLYRQGCFVLESKQGVERKEAEQAQALATRGPDEETPQRHRAARDARLGTGDDESPSSGQTLRRSPAERMAPVSGRRRRRPLLRPVRRLCPVRQELHPLSRSAELPHPPVRPGGGSGPAAAAGALARSAFPRFLPHRRQGHAGACRPPGPPRQKS